MAGNIALLREAEANRHEDSDKDDDESLKNKSRDGFLNILMGVIIAAFLIGFFVFVAFVAH